MTSTVGREIAVADGVLERVLEGVHARYPRKCFGYLVADGLDRPVSGVVFFEGNARNDAGWLAGFEARGRYFVDHSDAGFVATPDETWSVQQQLWAEGLVEVGVFHSHNRHPANFSGVDYELHMERYEHLCHLIVSMRNPEMPQVRAFDVSAAGVWELAIRTVPAPRTASVSR